MLRGLIAILFFQCTGELFSRWFGTPVPGPVIGMLLLLLTLLVTDRCPDDLARVADTLLQHLGLLFVPAAVGVVLYTAQLQMHGFWLLLILLSSTIVTVLVSALSAKWLSWAPKSVASDRDGDSHG